MKNWMFAALASLALVLAAAPSPADAKRLGGGGSSGLQRSAPSTPPAAAPARPAQQQAAPAQGAGAAGAAAAPKRSWMGPIAGLAAGLGLAALLSHFGLGEAFANGLMLVLLVVAGFALLMFVMRRFANRAAQGQPALAGAGAPWPSDAQQPQQQPMERRAEPQGFAAPAQPPMAQGQPLEAGGAAMPRFVPAAFDAAGFAQVARTVFIRLQAANDAGDLDDLRRFTTPEMFAAIQVDLLDRDRAPQTTEVQRVDAQVIDVTEESDRQIVSVRYTGRVVEQAGAAPVDFDELWHLVRARQDGASWLVAGIQQQPADAKH